MKRQSAAPPVVLRPKPLVCWIRFIFDLPQPRFIKVS